MAKNPRGGEHGEDKNSSLFRDGICPMARSQCGVTVRAAPANGTQVGLWYRHKRRSIGSRYGEVRTE